MAPSKMLEVVDHLFCVSYDYVLELKNLISATIALLHRLRNSLLSW